MLPLPAELLFDFKFKILFIILSTILSSSIILVKCETMLGIVNYDEHCDELPRMCYSCASIRFEKDWKSYKDYFFTPKNFTQSCEETINNKHVPVVECSGACITIVEQVYLFGTYVGEKYFRGCLEKTFKSRLVEENARRVLMQTNEQCKSVPRNVLFARPRLRSDNLLLCYCACDRCNGQMNSCRHLHECSRFTFRLVAAAVFLLIYFMN